MRKSHLIIPAVVCSIAILIISGLFSFRFVDDSNGNITIYQKGTEIEVRSEVQDFQIPRRKFAIRFSNKAYNSDKKEFYAAQIAAFLDEAELSKVKTGMRTEDIPCFEPGTGMAAGPKGYSSLIFGNSGHHYLYYQDKNNRRVNLISEKDGMLRLEFPISKLYIDGKDVKLEKTDLSVFYLAILIDRNLNKVIDEGELTRLTIELK